MQKQSSKNLLPLKSFHRSYREDYVDDFEAPGLFSLVGKTFSIIFKNWKLFFGLLFIIAVLAILLVGLFSQDSLNSVRETILNSSSELANGKLGEFATSGLVLISIVTTGGLSQDISDGNGLILAFIFLLLWLISIYFTRFILAKKKVTLRQGFYKSLTPLASTFVILAVILAELIPIFIVIIFYNAALKTDFLSTPFYALLFLAFAGLLILLSCYLVSGSIIALVAVTSPGLYPLPALREANNLIFRRRIRFVIRLFFLLIVVAVNFVVIMLPIILIDSALKNSFELFASVPVVPFFLLLATCFNFIFSSVYIYLYYRKMLDYEQN